MKFREEFPDFPEADWPTPMPPGFDDVSWRNDAMPRLWYAEDGPTPTICVTIDYVDPTLRETLDDSARFWVFYTEILRDIGATNDWDEVLALVLAEAFVARLKRDLTVLEWEEIHRRNAERGPRGDACHSHDFLDANMQMSDAFEALMGRQPLTDEDNDPDQQEWDSNLWNRAWGIAFWKHLGGRRV